MRKLSDKQGFTLIELIVALFVTMIVVGVATTAFILQNRASSVQQGTSDTQLTGQVTMELLERDIRMAGYHVDKSTALATNGDAVIANVPGTDVLYANYSTATKVRYVYFIEQPNQGNPRRDGGLTRLERETNNVETIAGNVENMRVTIPAVAAGEVPTVTVSLLIRSPFSDPQFTSPATIENFAVDTVNFPNNRRRAYTTSIRPRNFGMGQ